MSANIRLRYPASRALTALIGLILGVTAQIAVLTSAPTAHVPLAAAARGADALDPRDYGAVGDGASHRVASTLHVSTLAALAGYDVGGEQPYRFVRQYPHGVLFNLDPERPSSSGSRTLEFQTTGRVGVLIPTAEPAASGASSVVVGDLHVTCDAAPIGKGTPVSCGTGTAADTKIDATPAGRPGRFRLSLSKPTTASMRTGTLCTFSTRPAGGTYALPVLHTSGINRGDLVVGQGIQAGTQVDWVNHAKMEIVLSLPMTAAPTSGQILTFTPAWLSKVTVGMRVSGPPSAIPAGESVAFVEVRTGTVGLTVPLTGAVTPDTAMIGVPASSQTYATPITFYRPYTDVEAAALQMDRLGIQAAIDKAHLSGGGTVELPTEGPWLIDGPLIMPIFPPGSFDQAMVALGGRAYGENASVLQPTSDFGPGNALISCGDPTSKSSNQRGLYGGPDGRVCTGALHDLRLRPSRSANVVGLRPKWGMTPVAMDGIKEGPRLKWDRISVAGFDSGALAAIDHTRLSDSKLAGNFVGLRLDDEQPNLHGDEVFDRLYTPNNMWAGIAVSPKAYINAEMHKPYLSSNPYGIYCEPGPGAKQCIQGTTILNGNNENLGCGSIKDGGIRDGFVAAGGARAIEHLFQLNTFELGRAAFGAGDVPRPAGGCTWAAYFDVGYVDDWTIETVWTNDFAPIPGAFAHILRTRRIDGASPIGPGGFHMSGGGIWNVIENAREVGQNVAGGPGGFAGEFWASGSWQYVLLEGATFKARPMPLIDAGAPSLALGSLVEFGDAGLNGFLAVQRAGQRAGAPIAGVSCQDWRVDPAALQVAPVICFGGNRVPLLTTRKAASGQTFAASSSRPGSATAIAGGAHGPAVAIVSGPAASDELTYAKPLWAGQN